MTLREVISDFKGKHIRVGTHSAFIFCNEVTDKTEAELEELSNVCLHKYRSYLIKLSSADSPSENRITAYSNYVKNFTPFLNRDVVDMYESAVDKGHYIILIGGIEEGRYWCESEYINDKHRRDKEATSMRRFL